MPARSGFGTFISRLAATLLVAASLARAADAPAVRTFDVRDFGAKGDGTTPDTAAIQRAIATCAAQGGGTVRVPAGNYVCGTILLTNGVKLRLEDKAELLGSLNIADYQILDQFRSGNGATMGYCFVGAVDAAHVGIEGPGAIEGRGRELLGGVAAGEKGRRPFLVRFVRCTDVSVSDVHLQGPAAWTMHFSQCQGVRVERVQINSHGVGNNDGIDIDSSRTVTVRDCDIDSGDDAICLKTTSTTPCRDIEVRGCRLKSRWAAIKLGTESVADFDDINVTDCRITDTQGGGVKLFSVDGANLRNVTISNLTMENVTAPIFIRLGARLKTFRAGDQPRPVGSISNIVIRNVKGSTASPVGILISGIPSHAVREVTLENIELRLPGGGTRDDARAAPDEKESAYPEITMFGKRMPAFGIFARHVDGLKVSGLNLSLAAADLRPAAFCQDATNLDFAGWKLTANPDAECLVRFESVTDTRLRDFEIAGRATVFLRVEGAGSRGIAVKNAAASGEKTPVQFGPGVAAGAVSVR